MSSDVRKKLLSIEQNGVEGNKTVSDVRSRLAAIAQNGITKKEETVQPPTRTMQDNTLAKKREAAREAYSAKQDMTQAQATLKAAQEKARANAQAQAAKQMAAAALAGQETEPLSMGQWLRDAEDENTAAARQMLNDAFAREQAAEIKSAAAKAALGAQKSPLQAVETPTLDEAKYKGVGNKVAFALQNRDMIRTMAAAPADIDSAGLNLEELSRLTYLTEEEAEVYNRYLQSGREKEAEAYLVLLDRVLNARVSEGEQQRAYELAKKNKAAGVLGDVAMGYVTGTGALEGVRQAVENLNTGEYAPIDPNAGGMRFVNIQNALKEGLTGDIENPVAKKAADIGLGVVENLSRYPLGGLGMAAMTTGAAAQTMNAATKEGATTGQAVAKGLVAGAAEYITERLGMERFTAALAGQARGKALQYVLQSMVPEGLEEAAAEYMNRVADNIIMGSASEMNAYKNTLMEQGASAEEADKAAKFEFLVKQPLEAAVEGALSGGLITGIGAAADATVGRYGRGKALVESGADSLLYDAVNSNRYGKELQDYAGDLLERTEKKGKQQTWRVGGLYDRAMAYDTDMEASADRLARALGVKVRFFDEAAENGYLKNGYYKDGTLYINRRSSDPMAQVFAHELTHYIEGTDSYESLSKFVMERLTAEGKDLETLRNEKAALYLAANKELATQAAVDKELVAEYVQNHLLTNEKEIVRLAKQNRSAAYRVLNWIDTVLAKVSGNEERQKLLSARAMYGKALGEEGKGGAGEGYELRAFEDGIRYVELTEDQEQFNGLSPKEMKKAASKNIKEKFKGITGKDYKVFVNGSTADHYKYPIVELTQDAHEAKMRASTEIDNLLDAATNWRKTQDGMDGHTHKDVIDGIDHGDTIYKYGEKYYRGRLNVKNIKNGKLLSDMTDITDITKEIEEKYSKNPKTYLIRKNSRETENAKGFPPFNTETDPQVDVALGISDTNVPHSVANVNAAAQGNFDNNRRQELNALIDKWYGSGAAETVAARQAEKKTVREQLQEGKKKADALVNAWNGKEPAVTETEAPITEKTKPITEAAEPVTEPPAMTKKEETFQRRAEKGVVNRFADAMGVSRIANKKLVQQSVDALAEMYMETGAIDEAQAQAVFDELTEAAYVANAEVVEEYKDLREDLRSRRILIPKEVAAGIDGLADIRRKTFGKLRLTSEEGLPLDSAYDELSTQYPHLFPEKVTGAADQLNQIVDALDAIYDTETSLAEMNNPEWEEGAREAFNGALDAMKGELDRVKRSTIAHERKREEGARLTGVVTADEARDLKKVREESRKASEKVLRNRLLSANEQAVVRDLLRGERSVNDIPAGMDEGGIIDLYNARKAGFAAEERLKAHKKAARGVYAAQAAEVLHDFDRFKDKKSGIQYARETAERNIEDVVTDKAQAKAIKDWMLAPIHRSEAEATRLKNRLRAEVKALNLSRKPQYKVTYKDEQGLNVQRMVSESGLVQLLGEEKITEADLNACGADAEKIKKARNTFRSIYDSLLDMSNETLVRNGYDPISGRKNYFPHFYEEEGGLLQRLGFGVDTRELPTEIAGRTDTFRPGKTWFGNFLERKGGAVTYDAVQGFDTYIDGVCDVIYHTDNIQRLRAAETELRYQFSSEGIKEQVEELRAQMEAGEISTEEGNARVTELLENGETKFPYLVTWLREYTDTLANKKSPADRSVEHKAGRGVYSVMKAVEGRVAANMISLNPGSWLTNFIPITQVSGMTDGVSMLNALMDTVKSYGRDDGFHDKSDFLTNRRGSEKLAQKGVEKASALAGKGMELIDGFSSDVVVRALYYSGVKQGMSEGEAMDYANDMAARVMADRSKGAMPVIFNEKNPISKLLTMFQLEVNNQYSYLFKDLPRQKKEEKMGALVLAFAKIFIGAYLYNELYEKLVGRRAAFDPIDLVMDTVKGFATQDPYTALSGTATAAAEELPFVGGLLGGGRIPIQSALPDAAAVAKAGLGLASGDMPKNKALSSMGKELAKPLAYLVPPFGGGAVKKATEGFKTVHEGGSYSIDSKGEKTLRFAVEDKSPLTYGKAMLFGPYALKEAGDYVEGGFKSLNAKYTQAYEEGKKLGISYDAFKAVHDATRGIESDKDKDGNSIALSKSRNMKRAIDETMKLATKKQKEHMYAAFGVSEKVWKE